MKNLRIREFLFYTAIVIGIFASLAMAISVGFHLGTEDNLSQALENSVDIFNTNFSSNHLEKFLITSEHLRDLVFVFAYICTLLAVWALQVSISSRRKSNENRRLTEIHQKRLKESESYAADLEQREEELQQKSELINAIFAETQDRICAINRDFQVSFCNDAYREDIGSLFETKIDVGTDIIEAHIKFPKGQSLAREYWRRALEGESFTTIEEFLIDDTHRFFEVNYGPIRKNNGEIYGASNIVRDISERVEAKRALQREHDFINNVVEASNLLVMVIDLEGRIVGFNKACEVASGYRFEEVEGRTYWKMLIPSEETTVVKNFYQKFNEFSPVKNMVVHWITKGENRHLISWRNSIISDGFGGQQVIATGIDITEKEEFRENQSRILEILESSSDFIGISDMVGSIHYANPAAKEILGLDVDQDSSLIQLEHAFTENAVEKIQTEGIPTALKHGSWMGETEIRTYRGREYPVSHLILAHRNERGEVDFLTSIARDISHQKRLEVDILGARDAAIETARIKSEFLANMSHEIRTPMNGIIGLSELLRSTSLDKEQQDYVESIQRSSEILLTIVNDILDFSKMEAGKLDLETVAFQLRSGLESVLDLFSKPAERKNLQIGLNIENDVPDTVYGDPRRIRQVITNLIANAIKFTEEGEVIINVKLDSYNPENDHTSVRFEIVDTGIGIEESVTKQLFNPFTQADSSIQRKFGGTGLGLAISRQIVEMMQGTIGIESEIGVGSTFWFTVPLDSSGRENYSDLFAEDLRNGHILIAESNDSIRKLLIKQTKWLGMVTEEASTGGNVIKLMNAAAENGEPFDIVVIDSNLDERSGIETAIQIRKNKRFRKTRILLLASICEQRTVIRSDEIGIDSYIFKPIKLTELYSHLADLNNERKVRTNYSETALTRIAPPIAEIEENIGVQIEEETNSIRILVAEDNLVNQKVISNQIAKLGYRVDIVDNGAEAVEIVQFNDYSLILMDCEMPVLDGIGATEKIRKLEPPEKRVPIIAVTAHALEGDRDRCLKAGMDDYLTKPTKQVELEKAINRWLLKEKEENDPMTMLAQEVSEKESVRERLDELANSCGDDITYECLGLFKIDFAAATERLDIAIDLNDIDAVSREAHKLKGSAANMGAVMLPRIAEQILIASRNGDSQDFRTYHELIKIEQKKLVPIIEEEILRFSKKVRSLQPSK